MSSFAAPLGSHEDFVIGKEDFSALEIKAAPGIKSFHYFYHKKERRLIKQFVLHTQKEVDYICQVTLIEKGDKFTPRTWFSVRDKRRKIANTKATEPTNIKASVNLDACYENFWKLISYIQTVQSIDVPKTAFSLMAQGDAEIVDALKGRDPESLKKIVKELSNAKGVDWSADDINQVLKRKDKLGAFKRALDRKVDDEVKWQNFFEKNKWIFGYGLNYHILRQEQSQPSYGGTKVDGTGGQRGDYLTSTAGDLSFTVLVEIKTPTTPLVQGKTEIRNGAWSLSKDLTDAVAQIEANIAMWEKEGSRQDDNRDRFEKDGIYTVKPKGIIVIGSLADFGDERSKRETFHRFRTSIHGVDILTFDELYERAKFIVESK